MVKINLNIKKKDLWLLSAVIVFLIGVGYVVAYGGNQPIVMGHSAGEVEGIGATYVSGWQSISPQGSVTFNHPLGTDRLIITIQVRETLTSPIHQQHHADYSGWGLGVEAYEITNTQIKVSAGNYIRVFSSTGQTTNYNPAYIRVLAKAV